MLRHYGLLALRNVRRAPFAAAVNVLTLAIGLACFVTAYAYVEFWQSSERYFTNANRVYALSQVATRPGDAAAVLQPFTSAQVAELVKADFPALERVARAIGVDNSNGKTSVSSGERAVRLTGYGVDPEFLEIFALPFVAGSPRAALSAPGSVVLTSDAAALLFGDANPIGRRLVVGNAVDATVSGVIAPIPPPSHMGRVSEAGVALGFEFLASMDVRQALCESTLPPNARPSTGWFSGGVAFTYLLFPEDGSLSPQSLRAQLPAFAERHVPPATLALLRATSITFELTPLRDLVRVFAAGGAILPGLGVSTETELLLLGGLVLVIACMNYANLATARHARRMREVGLRRTLGAQPAQVMAQFLVETGLTTVAALAVALLVCVAAIPRLEFLAGTDFSTTLFDGAGVWLFLAAVAVAVTLLSGAYPALVLMRVVPLSATRQPASGPQRLTAWLVGAQFAIASLLLIAVIVTSMQSAKIERTGFGVTEEPVLVIQNVRAVTKVDPATLRAELAKIPQVRAVTELAALPWERLFLPNVGDSPDPRSPARTVVQRSVGSDFFSAFDIPVLAGRAFGKDARDDGAGQAQRPQNIVVDRAFAETFGFGEPAQALDRLVYFNVPAPPGGEPVPRRPARIVGVVESVPFRFEQTSFVPRATYYSLGADLEYQAVRLKREDLSSALAAIDAAWARLAPDVAINRRFLDDVFNAYYAGCVRAKRIFTSLAAMAFFIATVGLFGMATFVAGRRTKEIGLRKTLGGTTRQMVALLLRSFGRPVVIANVIAWPIAYVGARAYLVRFLDPVALTPWPFTLSLAITIGVACIAVAAQTLRSAATRPADVLRHD
jgi:putative ABC transport system permease protein